MPSPLLLPWSPSLLLLLLLMLLLLLLLLLLRLPAGLLVLPSELSALA